MIFDVDSFDEVKKMILTSEHRTLTSENGKRKLSKAMIESFGIIKEKENEPSN